MLPAGCLLQYTVWAAVFQVEPHPVASRPRFVRRDAPLPCIPSATMRNHAVSDCVSRLESAGGGWTDSGPDQSGGEGLKDKGRD